MSEVPARIGPYAIESRLGAGGMAETFVATRNMQGVEQRVCVKRILPAYAKDAGARKLFMREANISAALRHANLVTVLDVGEDRGAPYLVMELVEGADLGAILDRCPGKRLPADLVAFVLAEMAHGLHEAHGGGGAHAGVVHRDLSPSNVLISTMGEVKVADFGIAKALSGEKATATMMRGKFAYMAPEQLNGAPLDPRADFFALGVMGYEMIAGVRPFDAEHDARLVLLIAKNERRPVQELAPDAPSDLLETIEALLAPNKEERPPDGHAIVERLAPVVPPSMLARRKIGALAKAAFAARLAAASTTSPDAAESLPAFAATVSAPGRAPVITTPDRAPDPRELDIHSLPTQQRAPVVEPIGTNPSLSERLPPSLVPGMPRSQLGVIAAALTALFALVLGGAYVFSGGPQVPPLEATAAGTSPTPIPAPTTASTAPIPTTTPIAVTTTTPIAETTETPPVAFAAPPVAPSPRSPTGRAPRHAVTPAEPSPTPVAPTPTPTATATPTATPTEPAPSGEEEATAQLSLSVTPWGNVWVDHRYLGRAPTTIRVTPGSHQVQAGFDSPQSTRTVRVRSGQVLRVDFDLTEGDAP